MLIGMGAASGLGDRIGIAPMILIDAGFNILAALLTFALIRVSLQPAQPPAEINPATGEAEAKEAALHSSVALPRASGPAEELSMGEAV
jgi:hypothetical protein